MRSNCWRTTQSPFVTATVGTDGVQRATLTVDSCSFAPAHVIVQTGKPVELTSDAGARLVKWHHCKISEAPFDSWISRPTRPAEIGRRTFRIARDSVR